MNDNYNNDLFENNENNIQKNSQDNSDTNENLSSWSEDKSKNIEQQPEKNYFLNESPAHYIEGKEKQNNNWNQYESNKIEYMNNMTSKKKMDKGLKAFLIVITVILGATIIVFGASSFAAFLTSRGFISSNNTSKNSSATINIIDQTETEGTKTAEQIYSEVASTIVGVITYNPSAGLVSSSTGQGSGIIMTSDGYIVTNAHVIGNSNKYNVTVVTSDSKEYSAKIVGFDTRTDLAVLKIDATDLKAAQFGNSDQLAVGAWVLAIGNPGGLEFSNSLTRGLVSALNRSLGASNSLVKYIQTDAAINPGNSGGALLNMYGQVIGVNSSKVSDYEGMGFAIPINTVKTVVDDIIKNGYVSGRVKLGITVRPLSAYEAQVNNVPQGIVVMEISGDSDAAAKGLRAGDIITKFDGVDTTSKSSLYNELSKHKPGDTVKLTVYRLSAIHSADSATLEINVTLLEDKGEVQ